MRSSRLALGAAMLGLASMANAVPDPRQGKEIRTEVRQTKRQKDAERLRNLFGRRLSAEAVEIAEWNDKVDAAKRRNKNWKAGKLAKDVLPKKRMLPAPSHRGATVIGDLIFNYQVHSNNVMNEFTCQRAKEYMRRVGGRSIDGVKAEAEHLHRARNKHQKKVSRMIGGRTLRVILQLSNNQQYKADADRTRQWQLWEPVADGIWQYQVHDEVFPYFMFNDEAGELFELDPAKLHFGSVEDCNRAMHLYVETVNARHGKGTLFARAGTMEAQERLDAAEKAFSDFCEQHGRTLTAATNTISADEAGDENYALEG